MASMVFGTIGTSIAGPLGGAIGSALGSYVDNYLFGPTAENTEGPRLDSLSTVTAEPGGVITRVYGVAKVGASILDISDIREVKRSDSTGAKGSQRPTYTSYTYFADIDYLICAGPILGIGRIWANSSLIRGTKEEFANAANERPNKAGGMNYPDRYNDAIYDPALIPTTLDNIDNPDWDGVYYKLEADKITFTALTALEAETYTNDKEQMYWKHTPSGYYIPTLSYTAYGVPRTRNSNAALYLYASNTDFVDAGETYIDNRTFDDYYNLYDALNDFSSKALYAMNGVDDIRFYFGKDDQQEDEQMQVTLDRDLPGYGGRAHIVFENMALGPFGNQPPFLYIEVVQSDGVTIVPLISSLMEEAGLTPDNYDISDLPTTGYNSLVMGYILSSAGSMRQQLDNLMQSFEIDAVDEGSKIVFTKKHEKEVLTIDYSDFGATEDEANSDANIIETSFANPINLPRKYILAFYDPDRDYNSNKMKYIKHGSPSASPLQETLTMVAESAYVKELARKYMEDVYLGSVKYSFTLPYSYLYLKAGDVIKSEIEDGWFFHTKIEDLTLLDTGILEITSVDYNESSVNIDRDNLDISIVDNSYRQSMNLPTEPTTVSSILQIPRIPGDTNSRFPGFYISLNSVNSRGFIDAVFSAQRVSEETGEVIPSLSVEQILDKRTVMGQIIDNALPPSRLDWIDFDSQITVRVYNTTNDLQTISDEEFLNGVNMALVGNEIIYFRDVQAVTTNTFLLSTLIRGLQGTAPVAADIHSRFILLDYDNLEFLQLDDTLGVGNPTKVIISNGASVDFDGPLAIDVTFTGQNIKALPPLYLTATDGAINTITWVRQDLSTNNWQDNVDAPISISPRSYVIDIHLEATDERIGSLTVTSADEVIYSLLEKQDHGIEVGSIGTVYVYAIVYQMSGTIVGVPSERVYFYA